MKVLFLTMLLLTGCSVSRFYHTSEVREELKKNAGKLETMEANLEKDYLSKEAFFQTYSKNIRSKNNFVLDDLNYRIMDLKTKKDSILSRSNAVKIINNNLMHELGDKKEVTDKDRVYKKIEIFAKTTRKDATLLFEEYVHYRNASDDFVRFALITR